METKLRQESVSRQVTQGSYRLGTKVGKEGMEPSEATLPWYVPSIPIHMSKSVAASHPTQEHPTSGVTAGEVR